MAMICLSKAGLALVAANLLPLQQNVGAQFGVIVQLGQHFQTGEPVGHFDADLGRALPGREVPGFEFIKIWWEDGLAHPHTHLLVDFVPIAVEGHNWFRIQLTSGSEEGDKLVCFDPVRGAPIE